MKTRPALVIAAVATLFATGAAWAADAAPPAPPRSPEARASADSNAVSDVDRAANKAANEPNVKLTVIDDTHARIEELRVRGQLQKVTVLPKGGAPGYEILVDDGAREPGFAAGPGGGRGTGGKRVWNLLHF